MSEPKPIVEIRDLCVKYPNGVMALEGINLDVNPKDLIALIGPNGAGKSTLLKVILGLTKATSGTIKLFGSSDLGKNLPSASVMCRKVRKRETRICPLAYMRR